MGATSIDLNAELMIGMTLAEAIAKGYNVRAKIVDNKPIMLTADVDPNRNNVSILNGKIVEIGQKG